MPHPAHPAVQAWAEEAVKQMLERIRKALVLEYLARARDLR